MTKYMITLQSLECVPFVWVNYKDRRVNKYYMEFYRASQTPKSAFKNSVM